MNRFTIRLTALFIISFMFIMTRLRELSATFCNITLSLLLPLALTSCATQSYHLTQNEKNQMLAPLAQQINHEVGGDYSSLILKHDLLQLDPHASSPMQDHCPVSPIYAALTNNVTTRAAFENKIEQLKERLAEKQQKHLLKDTIYRTTIRKIKELKRLLRSSNLIPHPKGESYSLVDDARKAPQGGPYLPTGTEPFLQDSVGLFSQLDTLDNISSVAEAIPILTPMNGARVSSGFSIRRDPINGKLAKHEGIDFVGDDESPIINAATGRVISAGRAGSYGNLVVIDHGLGITTRYAHLKTMFVSVGDQVGIGQVIGLQGSTGRTTGAHLHYEVRINGTPHNPEKFIKLGNGCSLS